MNVQFKISEESFFNNGKIMVNAIPEVCDSIRAALSSKGSVLTKQRKPKGKPAFDGITADSLNRALRKCLNTGMIRGETHVENGVFFHKTKEGFDFSVYDEDYNLSKLYNFYQGSIGILNGDKKIEALHRKMGCSKKEWKGKIAAISAKVAYNTDYVIDKEILTVAGELQFGNWALIYRDLFRLLDADSNPGVDLYIYVAADEHLSGLLSDNTVSYKMAYNVISEYMSVIKTPIWLIGLGIDKI